MNEVAFRALPGCYRDTLDSFRQSPFLKHRRTFPHEPDHRGRSTSHGKVDTVCKSSVVFPDLGPTIPGPEPGEYFTIYF
jgi:hypothetical protein